MTNYSVGSAVRPGPHSASQEYFFLISSPVTNQATERHAKHQQPMVSGRIKRNSFSLTRFLRRLRLLAVNEQSVLAGNRQAKWDVSQRLFLSLVKGCEETRCVRVIYQIASDGKSARIVGMLPRTRKHASFSQYGNQQLPVFTGFGAMLDVAHSGQQRYGIGNHGAGTCSETGNVARAVCVLYHSKGKSRS